MLHPGLIWRHIVLSTYGSWLPGDPRGWRSRNHRKHSSGDYRNPPPRGEHSGFHEHARRNSGQPVVIPNHLRPRIGRALIAKLRQDGNRVLAVSIGGQHAHLLAELPTDPALTKRIIGQCKGVSSQAVRNDLPGRLWARDGGFHSIRELPHQRNVYRYILGHRYEGAWTWSFRAGEREPV